MNEQTIVSRDEVDAMIDTNGGTIYHAVENRKALIARRALEGKSSPRAESVLAALLALPLDYRTPKGIERDNNNAATGFGL